MKRIQYDELMEIAREEKLISLPDIESVVSDIMRDSDSEDDEVGVFDYANSPRNG